MSVCIVFYSTGCNALRFPRQLLRIDDFGALILSKTTGNKSLPFLGHQMKGSNLHVRRTKKNCDWSLKSDTCAVCPQSTWEDPSRILSMIAQQLSDRYVDLRPHLRSQDLGNKNGRLRAPSPTTTNGQRLCSHQYRKTETQVNIFCNPIQCLETEILTSSGDFLQTGFRFAPRA